MTGHPGPGNASAAARPASATAPVDHLVLPVVDLGRARSRLQSLGFTVAPEARHPFGSGNACVFFADRTYLEPLALLDRPAINAAIAEGVFFAARAKSFLDRCGEGFAMLAVKSSDIEADRARFAAAKLGAGPVFRFRRDAAAPDGTVRPIGVELAFCRDEGAPDATFFSCRHLDPDALWQPSLVAHANGARGICAVAAVAASPADFHILVEAATGQRELRVTSFGIEAALGGAMLSVLTPLGFRARYGLDAPDPGRGLRFAAVEFATADRAAAARFAGAAVERNGLLVVPPAAGLGAVLAFRSIA